jgi:hypothetical protein
MLYGSTVSETSPPAQAPFPPSFVNFLLHPYTTFSSMATTWGLYHTIITSLQHQLKVSRAFKYIMSINQGKRSSS